MLIMREIKKFVLENLREGVAILDTQMYQWLRFIQIEHFLSKVFERVVMPKSTFEELLPKYKRNFPFEVEEDYWFSYPSGIILEPNLCIFKGSGASMNDPSVQIYYTEERKLGTRILKSACSLSLEERIKSVISPLFNKYEMSNGHGTSFDYTPELIVTTPTGDLVGLVSSSTVNSAGDCGAFEVATRYTLQNQLPIVLTGDSTLIRDCEHSKYLWNGFEGILEIFVASSFLNEYEADDLHRIVWNSGAYLSSRDWFLYHSKHAYKKTWLRLCNLIKTKVCH